MNLVFNVNDLKAKVVPNIQRDSKYLNLSYDALASISVPSDFEYRSRLISLPQKIKEIESKNRQIENWVNVAIGNLKSAEVNNTNAMNRLSSSISRLNLGLNSKANNTGGKTTTTSKVTTSVKKAIDYTFSKKWILDASSLAKKTASKVVSKVKSKISWALSTGAKIVNKAKSVIVKKVSATLEFIGGKITSAWKWMSEKVFTPLGNILKRTLASIANVVISFVKGLCEFIESLFDVIVMLGAGLASIFTGIWDGITYLASDNKEEWESTTSKMWKETMGFVAEEHVENAYNAFFKETTVGQWLDNNAYEWFKSDGVVCGISSGLGYVAGIIILTVATAGIGTGAVAASTSTTVATQAAIATVSGIGKYTQESWAAKRDSSWEGIERMYQKGEISEEQFNSYVMIRELTDAEWAEIEQDYKNGLISEEEYNAMKQIREMPDDWKTLENGLKGLAYGVANGVWEGVQWYVGGKLAGWTIKSGSQVATSAVRVGADTIFNAADAPFRTTVEALTSDKTWEEAWTEQGGFKSMLTDTIIGLIGSVGGEVVDLKKVKKEINSSNIDSVGDKATDTVKIKTEIDSSKNNILNDYINNIQEFSAKGISVEEFLDRNGIKIIDADTKLSVAKSLGDSKLYMMETAEDILQNGNLSNSEKKNLTDLLIDYKSRRVGDLDAIDMLNDLQTYLSKDQVQNTIDILQSGTADRLASNYSYEQLAAIFNYTACGGFEINSWLNDINLPNSNVKARNAFSSVSEIQNAISGYGPNRIFDTTQGDILDCIDSVISSANYDNAVVTYRGVKELYDGHNKIDLGKLQIGDSFTNSGYQSSSVVFDRCYGVTHQDTDIILKIIVPPNSGSAAYIENITGVTNYGQMEMLIKRDATMTVVGDLEFVDVNGIMKKIIPVIVQ